MKYFHRIFYEYFKHERKNINILKKQALKFSEDPRSGLLTHTHTHKQTHTDTERKRKGEVN